jgi:hypothetical protein
VKAFAAALVLVLVAGTARAQPGNTPPSDPEEPPPPPPGYQAPSPASPQLLPPDRSESTALWLSLGGTIGSYVLLFGAGAVAAGGNSQLVGSAATVGLVGTLVAPTFGHWYGGKGFTRGFAVRIGAVGLGVTALVVAFSGCSIGFGHDDQEEDPNCGQGEAAGALLGLAALGMWVGGTVDDIIQAPKRVRRRNAARFAVTPLMRDDRVGLALVGAF